jgi:hypothetical protein
VTDAQSQIPDYDNDSENNEWQPLDDEGNVSAVSEYLAEMIAQLEDIAKRSRLDLLVYLLAMAKAEAQANAKAPATPPRA